MPKLKDATIINALQRDITILNTTKPKIIDKSVDKFVIKTLYTISGESDYKYLNNMIQALYANTTTLKTKIIGGRHRNAGLIMKETMYTTLETGTLQKEQNDVDTRPAIT